MDEQTIEFIENDVTVNTALLADVKFLPRVGDTISLPGSTPGGEGRGKYTVTKVTHFFKSDPEDNSQSCWAEPMKVSVDVASLH